LLDRKCGAEFVTNLSTPQNFENMAPILQVVIVTGLNRSCFTTLTMQILNTSMVNLIFIMIYFKIKAPESKYVTLHFILIKTERKPF